MGWCGDKHAVSRRQRPPVPQGLAKERRATAGVGRFGRKRAPLQRDCARPADRPKRKSPAAGSASAHRAQRVALRSRSAGIPYAHGAGARTTQSIEQWRQPSKRDWKAIPQALRRIIAAAPRAVSPATVSEHSTGKTETYDLQLYRLRVIAAGFLVRRFSKSCGESRGARPHLWQDEFRAHADHRPAVWAAAGHL
jgi:hypothetical protein